MQLWHGWFTAQLLFGTKHALPFQRLWGCSIYGSGNDQDIVYAMCLVKIIKENKGGDVYKFHLLHNPTRPDFRKKNPRLSFSASFFSATSYLDLTSISAGATAHLPNQSTQQLAKIVWGIYFWPVFVPPGFLQDSPQFWSEFSRDKNMSFWVLFLKEFPIGSMMDPCMVYLPTFTIKINQMQVYLPYMDAMGLWTLQDAQTISILPLPGSEGFGILSFWEKKRQGHLAVL